MVDVVFYKLLRDHKGTRKLFNISRRIHFFFSLKYFLICALGVKSSASRVFPSGEVAGDSNTLFLHLNVSLSV